MTPCQLDTQTPLYQEIVSTKDTTKWSTRKFTTKEAAAVKKLLATQESKAAQDVLAVTDITDYINQGQRLGIVNEPALVYFADLANQGGAGASGPICWGLRRKKPGRRAHPVRIL